MGVFREPSREDGAGRSSIYDDVIVLRDHRRLHVQQAARAYTATCGPSAIRPKTRSSAYDLRHSRVHRVSAQSCSSLKIADPESGRLSEDQVTRHRSRAGASSSGEQWLLLPSNRCQQVDGMV